MKKDKLEIEISTLDEKVIEEFFNIAIQLKEKNFNPKCLKKSRAKIFMIFLGLYLCVLLGTIILGIFEGDFLINTLLNSGIFVLFLSYFIKMIKGYVSDKKIVKSTLKSFSKFTLIFDTKGIKQKKKTKEISLCDWEQLKSILINDYSIIFLSNNNNEFDAFLYISTYYKERVIDILTELHKEHLIIDNTIR